jgi:hypothetical protein
LPARAKALNMTTFNGYFACTNCLTKGSYDSKVIFKYKRDIEPRSAASYEECLELLNGSRIKKNASVLGIKGPTRLSSCINILNDVLYDYMHLCCEGYIKRFLNLIVNSTSHKESFYIGKKLKSLNQSYRNIKVPHEFPRCIRDLSSLAYWKASELKVFMLYTGVAALYKSLEQKYFEHYCLYVLIIRQLCDNQSFFNADIHFMCL